MRVLYIISLIFFILNFFIVFYAMVGYPLALKMLKRIKKNAENSRDLSYEPTVSFMIVAHNEEKVIYRKLVNALALDYPPEKFQILIASDNSTDNTNKIVEEFIHSNPDRNIVLYCTKEHKGKTNAQNEAQKIASGEILVMTDANTYVQPNAIKELISFFVSEDIVYVCGKLEYSNSENSTGHSESTYWNMDLSMRETESRIKTITAGNGALYACRNKEYIDFNPVSCHDSIMPYTYAKQGKRCLFNPKAIAIEKAGENNKDEYKRKVRMNRDILTMLGWGIRVSIPFVYGWFGFFFFGHRTCRYMLWLSHILMIVSSLLMAITGSILGIVFSALQFAFFIASAISLVLHTKNKLLRMVGYYGMTVFAQLRGVINIITGKSKPVWEKAESTR